MPCLDVVLHPLPILCVSPFLDHVFSANPIKYESSKILLALTTLTGLELAELPSHLITKYRLMQHLDISKNQLTMIPDSMIHIMKQLRHFDCSFNELSELPKELEDFKVRQNLISNTNTKG